MPVRSRHTRHWIRQHDNGWTAEVWRGEDGVYYWRTYVTGVVPPDYRSCRSTWVEACIAADSVLPQHLCRCAAWPEDDLNLVEASAWREWLEAAGAWEQELRSAIGGWRLQLLDSAVSLDAAVGYASLQDDTRGIVVPIRVAFEEMVSLQQRRAEIHRQIPPYLRGIARPRIAARTRRRESHQVERDGRS